MKIILDLKQAQAEFSGKYPPFFLKLQNKYLFSLVLDCYYFCVVTMTGNQNAL